MESKQIGFRISENEQQVSENLCSFIIDAANNAIAETGQFTVGLSGVCRLYIEERRYYNFRRRDIRRSTHSFETVSWQLSFNLE